MTARDPAILKLWADTYAAVYAKARANLGDKPSSEALVLIQERAQEAAAEAVRAYESQGVRA